MLCRSAGSPCRVWGVASVGTGHGVGGRRAGALRATRTRLRRFIVVLVALLLVAACNTQVDGQASTSPRGASTAVWSGTALPPTGTGSDIPADSPLPSPPSTSVPPTTEPTTPALRPTPTTLGSAQLQAQHDTVLLTLLHGLEGSLEGGRASAFLAPFGATLRPRVGHWFRNTVALGVDGVLFAPADDYSSGATDSTGSFTRTVVLGIRTPYDDPQSMPGIPYLVTVSMVTSRGRVSPVITTWQPKYLDDPMNCNCALTVVHNATAAVVADASDEDLVFWSKSALDATAGIRWADEQVAGSGLVVPRGSVIFLADKPFHWFLSATGAPRRANMTAGLIDALGAYPGTRYSDQSRIVLMLQASDGSVVPNNAKGQLYASDVLTHESTHQLMNRNSTLPERAANSPPTWVVEGIAVAVETLHRDSLGSAEDVGYPEPNDPKNIDGDWFRHHLTAQMPTQAQLYASTAAGYYAIAGSVFRYLAEKYGYLAMMRVAAAMYRKPAQTPFDYFPDPDHDGATLSAVAAKSRWHTWFVANYE